MAKTAPSKGILEKMFGYEKSMKMQDNWKSFAGRGAKDIELPNESGKKDKRLGKKSPLENIMGGYATLKKLGKK